MPRGLKVVAVGLTAALCMGFGSVAGAGSGSCYRYTEKDRAYAKRTNRARSYHGVAKMSLDPQLSYVARRHTRAMVSKKTLFHTSSLGSLVTRWKTIGENVGYNTGVKSLHKTFMGSSAHKANILKSGFRHFGVGAIKKGGRLWVTVVFEGRKNPGTTLKMPSC